MNFKGDFKKLGEVDISLLKDAVSAITDEEWASSGWRQKTFEVHAHTQTIELIFDDDFRHSNPTYLPRYKDFEGLVAPLTDLFKRHFNKSLAAKRLQEKHGAACVIRMILVRLSPGGDILPHGDKGYSLLHGHRIHLPVISNPGCEFTVGDTTRVLGEGEVWEINNKRVHFVRNLGDAPRVHVITDWVIPGERCCCGKKLRPQGSCSEKECNATDYMMEECDCYPH